MSYTGIIDKIEEIIKSATDVGDKIYKYDRLERTESGFKAAFKSGKVIKAWAITRSKIEELSEASRTNKVGTTWIIRGYYSLGSSGATETTFQGLIDNVRDKFRVKPSLDGECLVHDNLQIDVIEPRMWGSILCHYVEMRLDTVEEQTYAETE